MARGFGSLNGWNEIRARIVGNPPTIDTWVNGHQITHYVSDKKFEGILGDTGAIALQIHGGGEFPSTARVRFRNIRVRTGIGGISGAPSNPSPAHVATGISATPTLTWTTGAGATSHDVYFGTTSPPPKVANVTETSYTPGTLTINKTYYWKVVAKVGSTSISSAVWSFKVSNASPADPSPAKGATGVSLTPTLTWTAPPNATAHDVYFGSTSAPPMVNTVTGTSYTPGRTGSEQDLLLESRR